MQPLFTYNVPQTSWYIVITDTSNHFYFNNNDKCSYWQLNDLNEHYGIDIDQFITSINFDELAVLIAKSRGVNIESQKEEVPKTKEEEKEQEEKQEEEQEEQQEEEIIIENVQVSPTPSPEPKKEVKSQSILQGYSSSEDEDEDEESANKDRNDIDEIAAHAIAQHQPQQDINQLSDDDDDDNNNSLDLSLDEDEGTISESEKQDFMNLLNQFSNKISIYDSWDLIEEELIEEFIKFPEYLAILSKQEREKIFQKWCSRQQQQQEVIYDKDTMINEQDTGIFPTPKLKFLNFLQDFKLEIKDSFYQSFYTANYEKINQFNLLLSSTKELIFRNYKLMLNDFTQFAKKFKKQNKNSNQNVKVMKLNEFLNGKITGSYKIDEKLSYFDNWIKLLNNNDISAEIAENEINFLVGDEKRLNSYIEQLN